MDKSRRGRIGSLSHPVVNFLPFLYVENSSPTRTYGMFLLGLRTVIISVSMQAFGLVLSGCHRLTHLGHLFCSQCELLISRTIRKTVNKQMNRDQNLFLFAVAHNDHFDGNYRWELQRECVTVHARNSKNWPSFFYLSIVLCTTVPLLLSSSLPSLRTLAPSIERSWLGSESAIDDRPFSLYTMANGSRNANRKNLWEQMRTDDREGVTNNTQNHPK